MSILRFHASGLTERWDGDARDIKLLQKNLRLSHRDMAALTRPQMIPQFTFLIRQQTSGIVLGRLRAAIQGDSVTFFNLEDKKSQLIAQDIVTGITSSSKIKPEHASAGADTALDTPWCLQALEQCLSVMTSRYLQRTQFMQTVAQSAINNLTKAADHSPEQLQLRLLSLHPVSGTLQHLDTSVSNLLSAMESLLKEPADMDMLASMAVRAGAPQAQAEHAAEVILEMQATQCYEMAQVLQALRASLKARATDAELSMATRRNYLLERNVDLSVSALAISVGTFIAGAFGQNLHSGVEEVPHLLWWVSGVGVLIVLATARGYASYVRRGSPSANRTLRRLHYMMRNVDEHFMQAEAALSAAAKSSGGKALLSLDDTVSKAEFKRWYTAKTGEVPSDAEIDLIFSVLDADNDGMLSVQEAALSLQSITAHAK